jgi:hypothetical protein
MKAIRTPEILRKHRLNFHINIIALPEENVPLFALGIRVDALLVTIYLIYLERVQDPHLRNLLPVRPRLFRLQGFYPIPIFQAYH